MGVRAGAARQAVLEQEQRAAADNLIGPQDVTDPQGRLVALYPFNSGWEALAADLESLL